MGRHEAKAQKDAVAKRASPAAVCCCNGDADIASLSNTYKKAMRDILSSKAKTKKFMLSLGVYNEDGTMKRLFATGLREDE